MNPRQVLRRHAKTFFWAWLLLPRGSRAVVAELYAFCREVDDLADGGGADAKPALDRWRARVADGLDERAKHFEAAGLRRAWVLDLMDGARGDLDFTRPADEAELERYCYRVAGVVGLMMCPLLGVHDEAAHRYAIDLGSAMQLTNIARDVAEDGRMGRVYVPSTWAFDPRAPKPAVRRLLAKADVLYQSGARGFGYLPWRARLSIAVAARTYRAIGGALARQDFDPGRGRAYVGMWRKVWLSLGVILNPRSYRALDRSRPDEPSVRLARVLRPAADHDRR